MARSKPLTERIEALVSALGSNSVPNTGQIKSSLMDFLILAQALEDGQAAAKNEAQIASLEAALKESETEVQNLKSLLAETNSALKAIQAEQAKQKDAELPKEQVWILQGLEPESVGTWAIDTWPARFPDIPNDEIVYHLKMLKELGYADCRVKQLGRRESRSGREVEVWFRTDAGNALVIAKRLAGEEVPSQPTKAKTYADLPDLEQRILVLLKDWQGDPEGILKGIGTDSIFVSLRRLGFQLTEAKLTLILRGLESNQFIYGNAETYDSGGEWGLRTKGSEYLNERDLL